MDNAALIIIVEIVIQILLLILMLSIHKTLITKVRKLERSSMILKAWQGILDEERKLSYQIKDEINDDENERR